MPTLPFTIRALDALKPPVDKASVEYWDSNKSGFGLRISSGGRKVWIVRFKVRNTGEHDRATLGLYDGMSFADARIAASSYLDAAQRGINLRTEQALQREKHQLAKVTASQTFGWLAATFLEDSQVRQKRSYVEVKRILNKEVLNFWGTDKDGWKNRHLSEISKADVRDLLDKTLARTQAKSRGGKAGKGVHANRVFSIIRRVFNFGIERDLIQTSPCLRLRRPLMHEETRDHVLSLEDLRRLWKVLQQEKKTDNRFRKHKPAPEAPIQNKTTVGIFKLMMFTAQRGAEVRSMAWIDLDLERKLWTIPAAKTKNQKSHAVPLSSEALKVIAEFQVNQESSPWVFPSRVNASQHFEHLQKAVQRFRKLSKVPYVGHDLRRTSASHMAAIGVPPHIIKQILNHCDGKDITQIYNRYEYEAEKREALQRWADYLLQAFSKPDEVKVVPLNRARSEVPVSLTSISSI
jgi:integrase